MPLNASGFSCRLAHAANPATSVPERNLATSPDGKWVSCLVPPEPVVAGMCTIKLEVSPTQFDRQLPSGFDHVYIFENGTRTASEPFYRVKNGESQSTRIAVQYSGVTVPQDYVYLIDIVIVKNGALPTLPSSADAIPNYAARFTFRTDNPNRSLPQAVQMEEQISMNWVPFTRKAAPQGAAGQSGSNGHSQGVHTPGTANYDPLATPRIPSASDAMTSTPCPGSQTPLPSWFSQRQG